MRISAKGTNIDTILAAFTGTTLENLTRVAFNDDVGGVPDVAGSSELVFLAAKGQTYFLQVGGFGGWKGSFSLQLAAASAPPLVTALSLTPATPDISSGATTVTFDVTVTHPAGLRRGVLSLLRPDGTLETQTALNAITRISGTAASGVYRVSASVRPGVMPGMYPLQLELLGLDARTTIYGERTPFPAGLPHAVPVVNTGVFDADPPRIALFTATPATLDVTVSEQTVTLATQIVDKPAGVVDFSSRFEVLTPAGQTVGGADFSRRNRVQGDSFDGTYSIQFTIPAGAAPGNYPLRFRLVDDLGNHVIYGPNHEAGELPMPSGLPDHFAVVNTGVVDTSPPILTGASVSPATINVAAFEPLNLTISAQDTRSGVESVELAGAVFGLRKVSGGATIELSMSLTRTIGTPTNGVWNGSSSLPTDLADGDYLVVGIQLKDALDNIVSYGPAALGLTAYPAGINPVVTIGSKPPDGPYLIWLKNYPSLKGVDARPDADPDGDHLSNLAELALGTNPLIPSQRGGADPNATDAPFAHFGDGSLYMDYSIASANLGTGPNQIQVTAEESNDLHSWSGAARLILGGGRTSAFTSVSGSNQKWLRLIVTDPSNYRAP